MARYLTQGAVSTPTSGIPSKHILLSIDWGTSLLSASYAICDAGGTVAEADLENIRFAYQTYEVPMLITVAAGEGLVWGCELLQRILSDDVDDEDVIDLLKLELYDDPDPSRAERCRIIRQQLEKLGLTITELISLHLKAVVQDCLTEIYRSTDNLYQVKLEDLPYRVRISVPQMWSPKACQTMMTAAKDAGLDFVALASEPENALAYLICDASRKQSKLGNFLKKGDHILINDIGGGTGDSVTYTLKDELSAYSRLHAVSSTSGALCGSTEVGERILHKIEVGREVREAGGLVEVKRQLGLSDIQWRKRALRSIETIKCNFTGRKATHLFTVTARHDDSTRFTFGVTQEDMRSAFDEVVAEIFKQIDQELAKVTPQVIVITGGFSRSVYLMEKLRARYERDGMHVMRPHDNYGGECYPVSRGGLLRYDNISAQSLPSQYGYAIIQDELYDWKKHPDAVEKVTEQVRSLGAIGHRKQLKRKVHHADPAVVFKSSYDAKKLVVLNRLHVFFGKGTIVANDERMGQNVFQEYYLLATDPKLSATLVYFEKELKTHDPSGRSAKDPTMFANGIVHLRTVTKEVSSDFLKQHEVPTTIDTDDQVVYRILCRVRICYTGGRDMKIGWELLVQEPTATRKGIACKKTKHGKKSEKAWIKYKAVELWEDDETVWDAKHSPFVESRPPIEEAAEDERDEEDEDMKDGDEEGDGEDSEVTEDGVVGVGDAMDVDE